MGGDDFSGNRTDWPLFEENAAISNELSHKGLLTDTANAKNCLNGFNGTAQEKKKLKQLAKKI